MSGDVVPFLGPRMFGGTVDERVKELSMMRISMRLRVISRFPLMEQIAALLDMHEVLAEVLPDLLQLRRPS